jgi:hypothetical protein
MRVEELTTDELKSFIGHAVEQKLEELLGDPDWNLELREDVKQRLRLSLDQATEAGVSIEDVASKTGLRW